MFTPKRVPFKGKVIDITVPISPFTPIFPGDPKPSIESVFTLEKDGCAVSRLSFGSHTGTHVDAPSHILKDGPVVDTLNLESLMGLALILDFSRINGALADSLLDKAFNDLIPGCIFPENVSILLLKTKASSRNEKSSGVSARQAGKGDKRIDKSNELEEPPENSVYLDAGSAAWIVRKGFKTVGIDNFSVDSLSSENLPAHHILLSNNVNIVECLDLRAVEAGTYFFLCLPLKIEGCDGAPVRALLISDS
jgi:arylformamidase